MTQFSQIAKIKHNTVEQLQRELQATQVNLQLKESDLSALNDDFARLAFPPNGTIAEFERFSSASRIFRRDIEAVKREIFALHQKTFQIRHHLKKALVEYEKINHLDKEEKMTLMLKAKKNETKLLDEISINARYTIGAAVERY
ncbi:MAG: flagellar export protein FliJ [Helicobacteraceae bacterium]|jgi:flagellar biosynthesis chaperone FliJ|nr:flagellar export protein FliJ [Helicobacteraceae bacterium]